MTTTPIEAFIAEHEAMQLALSPIRPVLDTDELLAEVTQMLIAAEDEIIRLRTTQRHMTAKVLRQRAQLKHLMESNRVLKCERAGLHRVVSRIHGGQT